jgi:prolyl oligopeptidase
MLRKSLHGPEEVLIDPHTLSPDHTMSIGLEDLSGNGKLMLYSIRRGGEDETELRVMDVDKRADLPANGLRGDR